MGCIGLCGKAVTDFNVRHGSVWLSHLIGDNAASRGFHLKTNSMLRRLFRENAWLACPLTGQRRGQWRLKYRKLRQRYGELFCEQRPNLFADFGELTDRSAGYIATELPTGVSEIGDVDEQMICLAIEV